MLRSVALILWLSRDFLSRQGRMTSSVRRLHGRMLSSRHEGGQRSGQLFLLGSRYWRHPASITRPRLVLGPGPCQPFCPHSVELGRGLADRQPPAALSPKDTVISFPPPSYTETSRCEGEEFILEAWHFQDGLVPVTGSRIVARTRRSGPRIFLAEHRPCSEPSVITTNRTIPSCGSHQRRRPSGLC